MADLHRRWLEFFLSVVVLPAFLFAVLYIPLNASGLGTAADFLQFYESGRIVLNGGGARLYDAQLQSEVQKQTRPGELPTHPPFEAVLFSPLAYFSYAVAFRVWTFLNLSLLGMVFFLLRGYGPPFGLPERLLLLAAAFYPVLAALVQGQDSLWILLAYVVAFLALKNGRDFLAGLLLAIGFVKPQLIVPFALLQLLRGRWKFIGGLAVGAAILAAVSMLVVGSSVVISYPLMLLHMNDQEHAGTFHLYPETMPNLRGLTTLVLSGILSPASLNLVIALISVVVLACAGYPSARIRSFDLSFSLALIATLLVSYHLLIHDLSVLILPAFLFLNYLGSSQTRWTLANALRVAPLALLFLTFLVAQELGLRNFSVAAVAVCALFAAMAATPGARPAAA